MIQLKEKFNQLASLFDTRNKRERALIASLLGAIIFNAWLLLFHDQLTNAQQKLEVEVSSINKKIETIEKQHKILSQAKLSDPNKDVNKRLLLAQQHADKLDIQLQNKMKGLIQPTQMAKVLEQVLSQQTRLRFIRIQSLAAKPLLVDSPETNIENNQILAPDTMAVASPRSDYALTDIGVYQHGIEMEFTGSYLDTLGYLRLLKKLPWHFYWDDVLFDVKKHPNSSVIIRVHTLSLKEGWLGV